MYLQWQWPRIFKWNFCKYLRVPEMAVDTVQLGSCGTGGLGATTTGRRPPLKIELGLGLWKECRSALLRPFLRQQV